MHNFQTASLETDSFLIEASEAFHGQRGGRISTPLTIVSGVSQVIIKLCAAFSRTTISVCGHLMLQLITLMDPHRNQQNKDCLFPKSTADFMNYYVCMLQEAFWLLALEYRFAQ